jgi:hypothetical protein
MEGAMSNETAMTLEQRIAAALLDANAVSGELTILMEEIEAAIIAADETAKLEAERAYDPALSPDPVKALREVYPEVVAKLTDLFSQEDRSEEAKRREFVTLIGSAAVAQLVRPPVGRAQDAGRTYRLAIMFGGSREAPRIVTFFDELKLLGFVEGKNLSIVPGGFDLRNDQYAEYARTLAKSNPDVIYCVGDGATLAARDGPEHSCGWLFHSQHCRGRGGTNFRATRRQCNGWRRRRKQRSCRQ